MNSLSLKTCLRPFIAVSALASTTTSSHASGPKFPGKLSIANVKKFVEEEGITSPQELLSRLPDELRSSFTLIPFGQSLHAQLKCTDDKDPRLVAYSVTDRFVMAFTNKDAPAECRSPEMMEAQADGSIRFDYVPLAQESSAKHMEGQQKCLSCHGQDSSPIWGEYPHWPGVYGSQDDSLPDGPGDKRLYESYVDHWRTEGVYSALKWGRDPYFPYSTRRQSEFRLRPNFKLGLLLARLEASRIGNRVFSNPQYRSQGRKFLAQHLGCDSKMKFQKIKSKEWAKFGLNPKDLKVGSDGYDQPSDLAVVVLMRLEAKARGENEILSLLDPDLKAAYTELSPLNAIVPPLRSTKLASAGKMGDFCKMLDKPLPSVATSSEPTRPSNPSGNPSVRCVACHRAGSIAPPIPFAEERFSEALETGGYKHGTLYDEIVYRVSEAKGDKRMPRGSSLEESQELPEFLEWLRSKRLVRSQN